MGPGRRHAPEARTWGRRRRGGARRGIAGGHRHAAGIRRRVARARGRLCRATALQGQLSLAEAGLEEVRGALASRRPTRRTARGSRAENDALRREVDERRRAQARLADVQRRNLELAGEKWVKDNQAADGFADVKGYKAQQDLLLDLAAGRVDGVISDIPGMQFTFKTMKGLAVKDRIKTGDNMG